MLVIYVIAPLLILALGFYLGYWMGCKETHEECKQILEYYKNGEI